MSASFGPTRRAPTDSLPGSVGARPVSLRPSPFAATTTETAEAAETSVRPAPRHHLVLLDDDDHTYEYVVEMLGRLFGYPAAEGYRLADEVHHRGRAIVFSGPLEVVEFKQQQIHAYGRDPRVASCAGSMSAVIEPGA